MTSPHSANPHTLSQSAKAWPFEQARLLVKRLERTQKSGPVIFQTGYGPSGLPHIGTFGEVVRTSMVRHAFHILTDNAYPTELIVYSDDMDGLRKVPTNLPNPEALTPHLDKPLFRIPDPFGKYESYAHHNNARLRSFLDGFGFDYSFYSSAEVYASGRFDPILLKMLAHFDEVMKVMLPTLGAERQTSYSPFLPISPKSGKVLQTPTVECRPDDGTILFHDEDGELTELPVTGGQVKIQWKPDWAVRWAGLGVDYEMSGKDLIESVKTSSKICKILGGKPPEGFNYELFLDEKGEKISKSKGNGLSVEDWQAYAPDEAISLFMFQKPKTAKRLYFDVIPKTVDEYFTFAKKYAEQDEAAQLENPVWHIHQGHPPSIDMPVSFSLLLNLVSAANADDRDILWGFIARYAPDIDQASHPHLYRLCDYAMRYYHDFIKPGKTYRAPSTKEASALSDLANRLETVPAGDKKDSETLQSLVYEIGKSHGFEPLRDWFKAIYEVLFGQSQGPRFGGFIALYGVDETIALIKESLAK